MAFIFWLNKLYHHFKYYLEFIVVLAFFVQHNSCQKNTVYRKLQQILGIYIALKNIKKTSFICKKTIAKCNRQFYWACFCYPQKLWKKRVTIIACE